MLNPTITEQNLSYQEYQRYARQIIIEKISTEGQKKLKKAKVICIGAGGLNTPALLYLAGSGIGTIGIIDNDIIEISNLQRQILYSTNNINKTKTKIAYHTLKLLNPLININSYNTELNQYNIQEIISLYDIIIDGTDNLNIRYIISQYCYKLHKIHIYGAIEQFIGHVSIFNYQNGPHYYNLYNKLSKNQLQNCNDIGIMNTLAGIIGTIQATEAIKIITGIGSTLNNHLLIFNILNYSINKTKIKPQKIKNEIIVKSKLLKNRQHIKYISLKDIKKQINKPYILIDIRTSIEFKLKHIDNAINIPLTKLKKQTCITYLHSLKNNIIILYCNHSTRSFVASEILRNYKIDSYILK